MRPEAWVEYFPKFGLDVFLVTRNWEPPINSAKDLYRPNSNQNVDERIIDGKRKYVFVPFRPNLRDKIILKYGVNRLNLIRQILTLWYKLIDIILLPRHFRLFLKSAEEIIEQNGIRKVIITAEPFLLFKVGYVLRKRTGIEWVADYRDCWTNERVVNNMGLIDKILHKYYYRRKELRWVESAKLITTPSPSYARDLKSLFPHKKVITIFNGYYSSKVQEEDFEVKVSNEKLKLIYVGMLYPHQDVESFLKVLERAVVETGKKAEVQFIGLDFYPDQLKRVLRKRVKGLEIITTPRLSYSKMIKKVREAHICLLFSKPGVDWLNTKVFDYLLAKREILFFLNDKGVLDSMLSSYELYHPFDNESILSQYLYDRLKNPPMYSNDRSIEIKQYSREAQISELSTLIKD